MVRFTLSLAMTLPKRFVTLTSSILQFDSKAVILSCMDLLGNLHNFQSKFSTQNVKSKQKFAFLTIFLKIRH